jgi:hypothetical protein
LGGLTTELSVVLVPLLLMLLIMPSEPLERPAAALRSLLGGMAADVAVSALVAPGTTVPFSPTVVPPDCAKAAPDIPIIKTDIKIFFVAIFIAHSIKNLNAWSIRCIRSHREATTHQAAFAALARTPVASKIAASRDSFHLIRVSANSHVPE